MIFIGFNNILFLTAVLNCAFVLLYNIVKVFAKQKQNCAMI